MSTIERKPILHGRDHCPGGADPIPCMISGPSGDFETVLLATGPYAYWRLGETGEPWADTSGTGPEAADLVLEAVSGDFTPAPTPDVTGALPAGQDDGAVELNYDSPAHSGTGPYLGYGGSKSFDMEDTLGQMSVCAWVKLKDSATNRRGVIIGNSAISTGGSYPTIGWGLHAFYPGLELRFTRGDLGTAGAELYAETSVPGTGGVEPDTWYFLVGTYDGAEIKLYVDAALADTTADASGEYSSPQEIRIGYGSTDHDIPLAHSFRSWLYGSVDEAAVWTRALSQAEIDALYNAGLGGGAGEGQVLLTDGAGGTTWDFPLEVTF